jgi:hypothetical protein
MYLSNLESFETRLASGFIAGFLATLVFHDAVVALLWSMGFAPVVPFPMAHTHPFGVPAFLSLAFWGGVWGMLFALVEFRFPHGAAYWVTAFLFGAYLPSLVAFLIVLPLKGKPMGGGWHLPLLVTAFMSNGAWGVGTGAILRMLKGMFNRPHHHASA